jgi:hypothetical protein
MAIDKRALRGWLASIREILDQDWNPIGDCPKAEYNTYRNDLAALIHGGADNDELLRYLKWAEVENIGLKRPFSRERGLKVVTALRALGPPQHLH